MVTARKHHYVPQCYLKGFVADRDNPKLFVVDGRELKSFVTTPANVAAERDFHRIQVEGHAPDALENAFSGFESELDQALRRIVVARSIQEPNDRAYLFNLIGLQATKHPHLRKQMEEFQARIMKQAMRMATATPERWASQIRQMEVAGELPEEHSRVTYEDMKKFVEDEAYEINFVPGHHLGIELETFNEILPLIFARKWVIFRAPPGSSGFVTSDHPMCLMWSNPASRGFYGPGLGLGNTQLLFPISSELAVMGMFESEEEECDADEALVATINGAIIVHADHQFYAQDDRFSYRFPRHDRIMKGHEFVEDYRHARSIAAVGPSANSKG